MPYCTCCDWKSSAYLCKHFFAIFRKFTAWQWNALSPLYRNSPFLTLDKMEHNEFAKSMEDEEEHVTNVKNSSIHDEEMLINSPCNDLSVPLPKRTFKTSLAAECRELLQRFKNLTFEVEESSAELKELHKTLNDSINKLNSATKKENGIVLELNTGKRKSKTTFTKLPLTKKLLKYSVRIGSLKEKITNASKIRVNQDKNSGQENQPIVLKDPVLDFCVDGREFFLASNGSEIEAYESVTLEDPSSTDENNKTVYNKIDSMISKESVLALKNNRLLSDDIINAL